MEQQPKHSRKDYLTLFTSTFTLSAFTFGGGFVIIPLMRKKFVEQLHWIDEEEMMDLTAIAQSSPGAIAVNASILVGYRVAGVPVPVIARRFHDAFVQAVVDAAELVRSVYGIQTVTLSGGVFMNRYLLEHALPALESAGFTAAVNRDLPPNDGCISFGQAVVAWARNEASEAPCEGPSA